MFDYNVEKSKTQLYLIAYLYYSTYYLVLKLLVLTCLSLWLDLGGPRAEMG